MFCIMDMEGIGPDFEVGITDRRGSEESWHSRASSSVDRAEEPLKEVKYTTEQQIEKLLNIEKPQSNSPTPSWR